MKELLSLGKIYYNDFLKPREEPGQAHELKLVMDEDIGAARLEKAFDVSKMFGKYWYRSGTNRSMQDALKDVVDSILPYINRGKWLDIACNDGTLLSNVPREFDKYGCDPCEFKILRHANQYGDIEQKYFSAEVFPGVKFDVITSIAMFYDLADPDTFCKDLYEVMADDGLWVIQMSYTPLMIQQNAFDNICHEHYYYHTFNSMTFILERNGFEIVDCTLNDTNGGSFRLFVKKKGQPFATQPYRDVCQMRMKGLEYNEWVMGIKDAYTWQAWFQKVLALKDTVMTFIRAEVAAGKTIMGYGASTKGNTLLQFFGLDNTLITAIAERQEKKWGLVTPGTNIPIISEEGMRAARPDYLLVLPWQFIQEFKYRESGYLKAGGKMIVCMPKFEVI